MNFNENIENEGRIVEKSRGCTYKITHYIAAYCPRVAHIASYKNHYLGFDFLLGLED